MEKPINKMVDNFFELGGEKEVGESLSLQISTFETMIQNTKSWANEDDQETYIETVIEKGKEVMQLLRDNTVKDLMKDPLRWKVDSLLSSFTEKSLIHGANLLRFTLQYDLRTDKQCIETIKYLQSKIGEDEGVIVNDFFQKMTDFFSLEEDQECDLTYMSNLQKVSEKYATDYHKGLLLKVFEFVVAGLAK